MKNNLNNLIFRQHILKMKIKDLNKRTKKWKNKLMIKRKKFKYSKEISKINQQNINNNKR